MSLDRVLRLPEQLTPEAAPAWFASVATQLLHQGWLIAGTQHFRLTEVEFYLYSQTHPDPFAHRQPIQRECGHWYFHRIGSSYRGGSFKGLDLTFGQPHAYAGILLRGAERADQRFIDGPSRLVDALLAATGQPSVASLDAQIAGRRAWEEQNPLHLHWISPRPHPPVLATARVGLTLKRAGQRPGYARFLGQPYRFLREARCSRKARPQLVVALAQDGQSPEAIGQITGARPATIANYLAAFALGQRQGTPEDFLGQTLSAIRYCQLLGVLSRQRT